MSFLKLHFFFFMAGLGTILPQLQVIGKDLSIPSDIMGTVTGILPLTFLLVKPLFGLLIDLFRELRKAIFMIILVLMALSFGVIYFIPLTEKNSLNKVNCENESHIIFCNSSSFPNSNDSFNSTTFWPFIVLMSLGTIGFNIINSMSDAICFDIVQNEADYGKVRLWGSVGFGLTGLIGGLFIDLTANYYPAYIILIIFISVDVLVCLKLKLPVIEAPKNICHDLHILLKNKQVVIFLAFAVLAGMLDAIIIYFLFWYLEDLALETNVKNIKLIEGLTLAGETLGAEVLFFILSGKIIKKLGHIHSLTLCFLNYTVRLGLISIATSPWWILIIEIFMQGPTYALTYAVIVAYANELAPPGMSATIQGIATGMADGTGYALGSLLGGFLYKKLGGTKTFQVFALLALFSAVFHFVIHKCIRSNKRSSYEEIK